MVLADMQGLLAQAAKVMAKLGLPPNPTLAKLDVFLAGPPVLAFAGSRAQEKAELAQSLQAEFPGVKLLAEVGESELDHALVDAVLLVTPCDAALSSSELELIRALRRLKRPTAVVVADAEQLGDARAAGQVEIEFHRFHPLLAAEGVAWTFHGRGEPTDGCAELARNTLELGSAWLHVKPAADALARVLAEAHASFREQCSLRETQEHALREAELQGPLDLAQLSELEKVERMRVGDRIRNSYETVLAAADSTGDALSVWLRSGGHGDGKEATATLEESWRALLAELEAAPQAALETIRANCDRLAACPRVLASHLDVSLPDAPVEATFAIPDAVAEAGYRLAETSIQDLIGGALGLLREGRDECAPHEMTDGDRRTKRRGKLDDLQHGLGKAGGLLRRVGEIIPAPLSPAERVRVHLIQGIRSRIDVRLKGFIDGIETWLRSTADSRLEAWKERRSATLTRVRATLSERFAWSLGTRGIGSDPPAGRRPSPNTVVRPGLLQTEAAVRRDAAVLGVGPWRPGTGSIPEFRVAFAGPPRSGKSTLVRALLGSSADRFLTRVDRHVRTVVPVEYCHGSRLDLVVRRPCDGTWVDAPPRTRSALDVAETLDGVGHAFDAARVAVPSDNLADWNTCLVDLPPLGLEPVLDALALQQISTCDAIVWVMHARGLGNPQLAVLEQLDDTPTVFVSNVWDAHLTPTSLRVDIAVVPIRDAPFLYALPIVVRDAHDSGPERLLLLGLLDVLRHAQIQGRSPALLDSLAGSVLKFTRSAAEAAETRMASLRKRACAPNPIDRVKALAAIQRFRVDLREHVIPAQERLREARQRLDELRLGTPQQQYAEIVHHVQSLAATYNMRAGTRTTGTGSSTAPSAPQDPFGKFIKPRKDLQRLIRNALANAPELMLGEPDIKGLKDVAEEIRDGRVEIAFLGMFSSGKSALINSLLGVRVNDSDSDLLPTRPTVTTATVCRLEWAERAQLNGVDWLDETQLMFLEEQKGVGIRVRAQEILAFRSWLRSRAVALEESVVEQFQPKRTSRPVDPRALVDALFDATIGHDGRCPNYLPGGVTIPMAGRVTIRKFHGKRPKLSSGMNLKEAFEVAERPEVSLQIATLRVGFKHPLLEFAAILDTPGTDSHVPHHRTLSRSLVKRRQVPVIYCFLSTQPGGVEDRLNLEVLFEGGDQTMRRVFFVITHKGDIDEGDREKLRTHVQERLAAYRMPVQALHFVELKNFLDPEFNSFSEKLTEFIRSEQGPLVLSWARRAGAVLREAAAGTAARVVELDRSDKDRASREKDQEQKLAKLEAIHKDSAESDEWGAPYVRRRVETSIAEACDAVTAAINGLTNREMFGELYLNKEFEDLNDSAGKAIRGALGAMRSKLNSVLSEIGVEKPADVVLEDQTWFDGAAALTAAEGVDFSAWDAIWDGFSYEKQVSRARGSILRAWASAHDAGAVACRQALDGTIKHHLNHLSRAVDRARRELETMKMTDRRERQALRARLLSGREHAESWAKRFDDWEKTHVDEQN